jgi:hypothetical protein
MNRDDLLAEYGWRRWADEAPNPDTMISITYSGRSRIIKAGDLRDHENIKKIWWRDAPDVWWTQSDDH